MGKDIERGHDFIPLCIIHVTYSFYVSRTDLILLACGSSEAQNPKYNEFKLVRAPSLLEIDKKSQPSATTEHCRYSIKLHKWSKTFALTNKLKAAKKRPPTKAKTKKK